MPSCTRTSEQFPIPKTASNLLAELQKADQIIHVMLNTMTSAQKSKAHQKLDAAGVSGDGMTRYHERHAVIDAAVVEIANATVSSGAAQRIAEKTEMIAVTQKAVSIADTAASLANDHIWPVIEALVKLADVDLSDTVKLVERMGLFKGLATLGINLVEDMAGCMESESSSMRAKLKVLQGGAA